jgi:dsDNA-specific endonuclease/ATPase MutS2
MIDHKFEGLIFSAELDDSEIPVLDLHGYTHNEAKYEIENFLSHEHAQGKRKNVMVVKIITGSGSGRLQDTLKKVLSSKSCDFIEFYRNQMQPLPSSAVTFIVLAPNS